MLKLVEMKEEYLPLLIDMMDEWYASGEKIVPHSITKGDYHDAKKFVEAFEYNPENKKRVPGITYFCLDSSRNRFVGAVNIRYRLNLSLLWNGGHIGDGIRPSDRRKGYGTQMIGLALEKCREYGMRRVLMVCDKNNVASAGSIQKNGGVLKNEPVIDGVTEQRYWIELASNKKIDYELTYCEAGVEQAEELVELYNQVFYEDYVQFGFCPGYDRTKEDMVESLKKSKKHIIYLGTLSVGVISVMKLDEGEYYLTALGVIPEYQHQGIGTKVMEFMFEYYSDWKRFTLCTPEEKPDNIEFYTKKCGFSITGKNNNNGVVEVIFERRR